MHTVTQCYNKETYRFGKIINLKLIIAVVYYLQNYVLT